jgi:hypothetical protein
MELVNRTIRNSRHVSSNLRMMVGNVAAIGRDLIVARSWMEGLKKTTNLPMIVHLRLIFEFGAFLKRTYMPLFLPQLEKRRKLGREVCFVYFRCIPFYLRGLKLLFRLIHSLASVDQQR